MNAEEIRKTFVNALARRGPDACRDYRLVGGWTPHVTGALFEVASKLFPGSTVAAKGLRDEWERSEYLSLDVTASPGGKKWGELLFAGEVENVVTRTPYSIWKLLATDAKVRVAVGYFRRRKSFHSFDEMVAECRKVRNEYGRGRVVLLGADAYATPKTPADFDNLFRARLID